jgi:hypothetical protein
MLLFPYDLYQGAKTGACRADLPLVGEIAVPHNADQWEEVARVRLSELLVILDENGAALVAAHVATALSCLTPFLLNPDDDTPRPNA